MCYFKAANVIQLLQEYQMIQGEYGFLSADDKAIITSQCKSTNFASLPYKCFNWYPTQVKSSSNTDSTNGIKSSAFFPKKPSSLIQFAKETISPLASPRSSGNTTPKLDALNKSESTTLQSTLSMLATKKTENNNTDPVKQRARRKSEIGYSQTPPVPGKSKSRSNSILSFAKELISDHSPRRRRCFSNSRIISMHISCSFLENILIKNLYLCCNNFITIWT